MFVAVSAAAVAVGSLKPSAVTNGLNPRRLAAAGPIGAPPIPQRELATTELGPATETAWSRSWRRPVDCSPATARVLQPLPRSPTGAPRAQDHTFLERIVAAGAERLLFA